MIDRDPNSIDSLTAPDLLSSAGPYLQANDTQNRFVREFIRRIRLHLRSGLNPEETAQRFGLGSYQSLKYRLDQANVRIEGERVYTVKAKTEAAA